jgi:uncharacterized protein
MNRVVHFEINVDNVQRSVQFYSGVFGWKIEKWEGPMDYWLVSTGKPEEPGIDGAIQPRQSPQDHTVNTIEVESIDTALEKIVAQGGSILTPKSEIPGIGSFAQCIDPDGNVFGLMQNKPASH